MTDLSTGQSHVFHILGAWDSDPVHGVISYPAALAQAMFNKKPGDTVEAADENGKLTYRIDRIEKTPTSILQTL